MAWMIDASHSQVQFSVRHMMISNVHGRFENFNGTVNVDEKKPENSNVDVKIEVNSINTRDPKRDEHLRSGDFFESEKYPYITFVTNRVKQIDATNGQIIGELMIRNVSRKSF